MRSRRIERLFESYRTRGDGAALAAVFDATAPRLLELACHLVRDPSEAEDLVQSTFLAAIRHAQRYDASAPLEGWLYGILWREALKAKRRASRRIDPRELGQPAESDPGEVLAASELPQAVREALERLPKQEREVLEPFLLEDLRADEIARKLERSAGTVRSQIHRALGRLRRNLPASLTPLAGIVPIRGLDVVRAEVLSAACVPATTAAAVVGGGLGLRVLLGALALALVVGGWLGLKLAIGPAESEATPLLAKLETEPPAPASVAAETTGARREPVVPTTGDKATIALTLVNWPKEHPVAGLRVEVWPGRLNPPERYPPQHDSAQKPIACGRTSADGRVDLEVPSGAALRIELPLQGEWSDLSGPLAVFYGKVLGVEPLEASEHKTLRFQVLYGWEFSRYGRVVADEDGHPLANARVLCTGLSASDWAIPTQLSTSEKNRTRWLEVGANGEFELKLTYEQQFECWFVILAPGRTPVFTKIPGSEQADSPLEIRLRKSASFGGRLVDASGASTAHLRVTAWIDAAELVAQHTPFWDGDPQRLAWVTESDAEGRFEFPELPAPSDLAASVQRGEDVLLRVPLRSAPELRLEPGLARQVEWHLGRGARVTGSAYDKNLAPVAKREIWLLPMAIDAAADTATQALLNGGDRLALVARTRTDESGRFAFDNVEPGTWWVGIAPPDDDSPPAASDPAVPLAVKFQIPQGTPSIAVDIRPKNTLPILGKVLRPDGSPIAGAGILMSKDEYPFFADERTQSGSDGTFSVLPSDTGTWRLRAWAPDEGFPYSPVIEARAGDDGVLLKLVPPATISGEVVCSDCGVDQALAISLLGKEPTQLSPSTLGRGRTFRFDTLEAGTYAVLVRCEPDRVGFARGIVANPGVEVGGVRIELATGAVLVVRYSGKELRSNFTLWLDGVHADDGCVRRGDTLRIIVPPGTVKLRPDSGGKERVFQVVAGTETEVVLDDT